jgi:hypothetical protein
MNKHVICHIHTLDHPGVFKILNALSSNDSLFDGLKIATLTNADSRVFDLSSSILNKLGYTIFEVGNDELRETNHFFNTALPYLLEHTKQGVLCYCHSKGVTYHPDSDSGKATSIWTDVLIDNVLNNAIKLPFDNAKYKTFGSCRIIKNDFLPDKLGEKFSYIGTYYWIKVSALLGKEFKPTSKFYLEALPGLVATQAESFNIGPSFTSKENPYKIETWTKKGLANGLPNKN